MPGRSKSGSDDPTTRAPRLAEPRVTGGTVYWLESAPEDESQMAVFGLRGGHPVRLTPPGYGIRSRVHEYGGGAYLPTKRGIVFVGDRDQALYRVNGGGEIERTLALATDRYADLSPHPDPDRVLAVMERHGGSGGPHNFVALCDLGEKMTTILCRGADFYLAPRIHPDGRQLCWIEWDHPDLPWQGTRLRVGRLGPTGELVEMTTVAGSRSESVLEPVWGPGGRLYFISDRTGWANLYRWHPHEGVTPLSRKRAELGRPPWNLGQSSYALSGPDRIWAAFSRRALSELWRLDLTEGASRKIALPFGDLSHVSGSGRRVVALFHAADRTPAILLWHEGRETRPVTLRGGAGLSGFRNAPQSLEFPGPTGLTLQGFWYRPPGGSPPFPLLVRCHGGPTAMASPAYDARIQGWLALGLSVLDVNYRGSSGFGRAYREALAGGWGQGEVEDIEWGIRHLVARGLADPTRLFLTGSSAGGLTALALLTRHPHFQAASLFYPVTDLLSLEQRSPKFESHYGQFLIAGNDPASLDDRLHQRSPCHQVARMPRIPLLIFQGLEDSIVPPEDARRFTEALKQAGIPVQLIEFAGEGHGFRRHESWARVAALESHLFNPARPTARSDGSP